MKKIQEFIKTHYGQDVALEYRTFCICSMLGTVTSLLGAMICIAFAGLDKPVSITTSICFVMMLTLTTIGYRNKKIDGIVMIMSCMINFVLFPFIFLSSGALYSNTPMFFIMGIVIAAPILRGNKRIVLCAVQLVYYMIVISICFFNKELSFLRPQGNQIVMLLFSFVIVAFYIFSSTVMVTKQYEKERDKAEELNRKLVELANRDPLTKLYNRRYLTDFLDNLLKDHSADFSVILIDIDDFKLVNDQYGHITGDNILIAFSNVITELLVQHDFACRFGGEEFMIYCHTANMTFVEEHMAELKTSFSTYCMEHFSFNVTFSAGAAAYTGETQITELFNKADMKLYEAKHSGKNCFLH